MLAPQKTSSEMKGFFKLSKYIVYGTIAVTDFSYSFVGFELGVTHQKRTHDGQVDENVNAVYSCYKKGTNLTSGLIKKEIEKGITDKIKPLYESIMKVHLILIVTPLE